jgi:hypothetical protein
MSLASSPFYWLTCDGPDCKKRCPSEDDQIIAWVDDSQAEFYADDSDWRTVDGKHYCADCSPWVCHDCGAWNDIEYPGEQDYLCIPCWNRSEDGQREEAEAGDEAQ